MDNVEDVRRKYHEGHFLYLFQLNDKDMIHIELEEKFEIYRFISLISN